MLTSVIRAADYPNDYDASVKASGLSGDDFNSFLKFKTGGELIKLDSREAMLRVNIFLYSITPSQPMSISS